MIDKYLSEIWELTPNPGTYAFRGQENSDWELVSSAARRLSQGESQPRLKNYIDYHRDLLERARRDGFGEERGKDVTDLQLLAKLQHFGAATGLLDFTWNPLVALWFATIRFPECDGKLFVLNADDVELMLRSPNEEQVIESLFSPGENDPPMLYWEPTLSGDAMQRILIQRSVFIIGRPTIPTEAAHEITIPMRDKPKLSEALRRLDLSETTLFRDLYGFAQNERSKLPTAVPRSVERQDHFALLREASNLFSRRDYPEAIVAYDKFIKVMPNVAEAYFFRGLAEGRLRRWKDSIADYDKATRLRSDYAAAYINRGRAKEALGLHGEAVADYDEAIRLEPENAVPHRYRGDLMRWLQRPKDAIADYDEAIRLDPSLAGAYSNRASAKHGFGLFEDAITDYDKAIDLDPGLAAAYNCRGAAKHHLERFSQAVADYDFAIGLDPKFAEAWSNRGKSKASLGLYEAAVADCSRAISLKPDYAEAYFYRGTAYHGLGLGDLARRDFKKAADLALDVGKLNLARDAEHKLDSFG